jgi:superfamily II DNA or RNA helicase
MSILYNVKELTQNHKNLIIKDLQFENPNTKKWIEVFDIDEKSDQIFIPYAYARQILHFKPNPREYYPSVKVEFQGKLREYQLAVKKQAVQQLNKTGSCLLSLHVGWGKSIMAVYLATKLQFKTLIVVSKLMLVKQWIKEVENFTNAKCQFIKTNVKELDPECDFYIINSINVPKMGCNFFKTIGCIIMDECHLLMAEKLYKTMFTLSPKYVIGLSATPYRPDGLNVLLDLYFGTNKLIEKLYKPHTVYAVRTGISIDYDVQWDGKMNWNSVLNNQGNDPERNQLILDIIRKFSDRYFLVLCKRIEQGNTLVQLLSDAGEYVTNLLGSKKEFDENARIIVATTQKCGVGFSHSKLNALLLASDMEEYFIQYLGRVFRTPDVEPIVFDLIDDLPILNRHYSTRKRVYKQSGGKIQDISNIQLI